METNQDWKTKTFIIGGVVGLLSGLFAAYLFVQRNTETNQVPQITGGDGVKVGLGVLGVLRLIADLGEK